MKVELKRNVLHGVRVVQAGKIIDVTNELAQELINGGLATASTKDAPEGEVVAAQPRQAAEPSTDWKLDELKAYAKDHGVENAQSFRSKQDAVDAINAKTRESAS